MRILAILLCLVPFSATAQQQSVSTDDLIAQSAFPVTFPSTN